MTTHRDKNGVLRNEDGSPVDESSTAKPLNFFDPSTWLSGLQSGVSNFFGSFFNLGNIFTIGLVLIGGYFLAKSEPGQKFLNDLIKKLPEEARVAISGFTKMIGLGDIAPDALDKMLDGMTAEQARDKLPKLVVGAVPAEVVNVIARDKATWDKFRIVVKEANGGHFTLDAMNNPKVISALLLQCGPMVRDIITTTKGGANGGGQMVQQIMGTVAALVKDPTQLASMLSDANRLETMRTVAAISPIPFSPEKLSNFVRTVGMTDAGQPTDAFRTFLTSLLTDGSAKGVSSALLTFLNSPEVTANPQAAAKAFQDLARSVDVSQVTDASQKQLILLLQKNAEPTLTLIKTLGTEKSQQLMDILSAPAETAEEKAAKAKAMGAFVLAEPAFKTFADTPGLVESLPAGELRTGLSALHGVSSQALDAARGIMAKGGDLNALGSAFMLKDASGQVMVGADGKPLFTLQPLFAQHATDQAPLGRDEIRQYGVKNLATLAHTTIKLVTEKNLNILLTFAETIGKNPANKNEGASKVVTALQDIMLNHSAEAFTNLTGKELSDFFADKTNHKAVDQLISQLEIPNDLPADQRMQLAKLKHAWSSDWIIDGKRHHESVGNVFADVNGAQFIIDELKFGPDKAREMLAWATVATVRDNKEVLAELAAALPKAPARPTARPAH